MEIRIRDDWYGNSYENCNVDDLINRLNNGVEPTYEVINDINRYNFDFDYYCDKTEFDLETAEWLKNKLETYIFDALHAFTGIEPNISIATSHTNNYSETEGKYSIRFYITNLMDNKENMKSFVEDLNIIVSEIKDDPITSVIKIDNNKVFDTSIYSSNKKLRCVNTSKPNENRPLLLKKGNIEDTIVTNIKDCIMVNYVSDRTSPTSVVNIEHSVAKKTVHQKLEAIKKDEDNNKLEKLIFFAENGFHNCCTKHEDIYKIGFALANVFQEDGKELFLFFAEEYTSIDWETKGKAEYEEKYAYYLKNNKSTVNLGTIYWIFKNFNKKLFDKVSKEWNLNHYNVDLIYNKSTGAFADYFKNIYGDFICASNGFVYMYNGIRWKKCNDKNTELICFIDKVFHKDLIEYGNNRMKLTTELLKDATDEAEIKLINDKIGEIKNFLGGVSFGLRNSGLRHGYISDIIAFSTDDNIKFDSNCYLFAFENKIYDLEHNCFIDPSPEQYISKSCNYNYDDTYDLNNKIELETLLNSIFPNKDIKDYYLTYLATGLSGIHMQEFMIATGVGGNGKSLINGLMMNCIGDYGYVVPNIVLTKEIKDGPNPELAKLDNVRFALMSEPDSKKKFCCGTLKEITGNDTLPVRLLQSNKVGIDLLCTIVCEGNDIPDFDEVNQAMNRRVRATIFESIAIEKEDYDRLSIEEKQNYCVKNSHYITKEFKEKHRQALFMILTEYFKLFIANNNELKPMPPKCKAKVVNLFATSDNIYSWFEEIYEPEDLTTCIAIPIKDVYDKFSSSSYFMKLPKQEQRKFNKKNFTEKITTNLFLQKSLKFRDTYWKGDRIKTDYLVGWKLKPFENDCDLG